jgi:hypothetical protein
MINIRGISKVFRHVEITFAVIKKITIGQIKELYKAQISL